MQHFEEGLQTKREYLSLSDEKWKKSPWRTELNKYQAKVGKNSKKTHIR